MASFFCLESPPDRLIGHEMRQDLIDPLIWWCTHWLQESNPWRDQPWIENKWLWHKSRVIAFKISWRQQAMHQVLRFIAKRSVYHQGWQEFAVIVASVRMALKNCSSTMLEQVGHSPVDVVSYILRAKGGKKLYFTYHGLGMIENFG